MKFDVKQIINQHVKQYFVTNQCTILNIICEEIKLVTVFEQNHITHLTNKIILIRI